MGSSRLFHPIVAVTVTVAVTVAVVVTVAVATSALSRVAALHASGRWSLGATRLAAAVQGGVMLDRVKGTLRGAALRFAGGCAASLDTLCA